VVVRIANEMEVNLIYGNAQSLIVNKNPLSLVDVTHSQYYCAKM
jgi:hypothetical protein